VWTRFIPVDSFSTDRFRPKGLKGKGHNGAFSSREAALFVEAPGDRERSEPNLVFDDPQKNGSFEDATHLLGLCLLGIYHRGRRGRICHDVSFLLWVLGGIFDALLSFGFHTLGSIRSAHST
jgi:hypothetical protein